MHNHNAVAAVTFLSFLFGPAVLASTALRERVHRLRGFFRAVGHALAGIGSALAAFASGDWLPSLPTLPARPKFQWARRTPSRRQIANMPRMLQQMYQPQPIQFHEVDPAQYFQQPEPMHSSYSSAAPQASVAMPQTAQVIQPEAVPHHFAPAAQFERLDLAQYMQTLPADPDRFAASQPVAQSVKMPEPERIHTPRPPSLPFRQLRSALVRALLFSFDAPILLWRMAREHYRQPSARNMTPPPMLTVRGMAPPW